jgi:hypothetical protein
MIGSYSSEIWLVKSFLGLNFHPHLLYEEKKTDTIARKLIRSIKRSSEEKGKCIEIGREVSVCPGLGTE